MAEFTKDIQTLTKQQSQSPSLQANTGSLATDLTAAVGFGLDLYRQKKATDQLKSLKEQQAGESKNVAQGALDLASNRALWKNSTPSVARMAQEKWIQANYEGRPEMAMAVIKAANTTFKEDNNSVVAEATQRYDDRKEKVTSAIGYASSVKGWSQEKIDSLPDEEFEALITEQGVFNAKVDGYLKQAQASPHVTQDVINVSAMHLREQNKGKLDTIMKLFSDGKGEEATIAAQEFRDNMVNVSVNAPTQIKKMLESMGRGSFFDAALVKTYSDSVIERLESPEVKDMLSGKETSARVVQKARASIDVLFTDTFIKLQKKRADGGRFTAQEIQDYNQTFGFLSQRSADSNSLVDSGMHGTWSRMGGPSNSNPPPASGGGETGDAEVDSNFFIDAARAIRNFISSEEDATTKKVQDTVAAIITSTVDDGLPLTAANKQWLMDGITYGENGTIEQKGAGAKQAVINGPLAVLTHPDYKEKLEPSIKAWEAEGVDLTAALVRSMDNHIRNNFFEGYTQLATSATSPFSAMTAKRSTTNRPAMPSTPREYNVKDDIEIRVGSSGITFGWKAGTIGQSTDMGRYQVLRKLNGTTVVINKYLDALSNVSGVDKKEWTEDLKVELDNMFGLTSPATTQESVPDLSSYEDGEYEDGRGNIVVIKGGKEVEVR